MALRQHRAASAMSQDELAQKARALGARVAGPHICLYEQDKRKPQLATVLALAASLRVPPGALLPSSMSADVERLRLLAGWSQRALAHRLGVAQARWSRIERGLSALDESKERLAAELLKVSVEQLRRALDAQRVALPSPRRR